MGLLRKHAHTHTSYHELRKTRMLQDISNILNTKKGFGSLDPDFGIEDISHYTQSAMISAFIKGEIRRNILKYYPQIEIIDISDAQAISLSRIQIQLDIKVNDDSFRIRVYNENGLERWIVDT